MDEERERSADRRADVCDRGPPTPTPERALSSLPDSIQEAEVALVAAEAALDRALRGLEDHPRRHKQRVSVEVEGAFTTLRTARGVLAELRQELARVASETEPSKDDDHGSNGNAQTD